jgi:ribose-phosphate pyrophosphokinase
MGGVRRARNLAQRLNLPIAFIEKRRARNGSETQMVSVIGEVEGKNVIIADDEIDTAGTLCDAARFLRQVGACELMACATHPILSKPAAKRIEKSDLTRLVVTDTVPIQKHKLKRIGDRLEILSVAPLLGDVISRIHTGQSVGELFDE